MALFRSLAGTVRLELTSADVAGVLQHINEVGVSIWSLDARDDLTVHFSVYRANLSDVENIAVRRGDRLRILSHKGLYWGLTQLGKRPILLLGMFLLILSMILLPGRVMFVSVEGNSDVPSRQILEAAQTAGIRFGALSRDVRSEKVKNTLLGILPQLQWAGINTYGCTAVISVRERVQEPQIRDDYRVSNIVAACDGVITSFNVTNGTPLCRVGQAVQKGEQLISGYMDSGQILSAVRAEGEVFASTKHTLTVQTPSKLLQRGSLRDVKTNFMLIIGKKRINFMKGSGIYDGRCVKMYSEYHLTLPGGFRLPVRLVKETVCTYDTHLQQSSAMEMKDMMSAYAKAYFEDQRISLTIGNTQEVFGERSSGYYLCADYVCTEMIGREQREQIGDFHGKTD